MNKKIIALFFILLILGGFLWISSRKIDEVRQEELVFNVEGSLPELTMDDLIAKAEIIVIGELSENLPSKWKSPNGTVPADLTSRQIIDLDLSIFTDALISVDQILKGTTDSSVVRVRTFKGEIDNVRFESSSEPTYIVGAKYLLFLHKDAGPTQIVDPGNYIPVGAILGVYQIDAGRAVSQNDEWELDMLIGYIKSSQ